MVSEPWVWLLGLFYSFIYLRRNGLPRGNPEEPVLAIEGGVLGQDFQ